MYLREYLKLLLNFPNKSDTALFTLRKYLTEEEGDHLMNFKDELIMLRGQFELKVENYQSAYSSFKQSISLC
jgi:hypothetical protein